MIRIYSVPGISCGHCKAAIESSLAGRPGVDRVEVDVEARTVAVEGDASIDSIRAGVDEAGYEVASVLTG